MREQSKKPLTSDVGNYSTAVRGKKFSRKTLHENFFKLVDSEEYNHLSAKERKQLMRWIEKINNMLEEG